MSYNGYMLMKDGDADWVLAIYGNDRANFVRRYKKLIYAISDLKLIGIPLQEEHQLYS